MRFVVVVKINKTIASVIEFIINMTSTLYARNLKS